MSYDDDKSDLTRIEDLAAYEHVDDTEVDEILSHPLGSNETSEGEDASSLEEFSIDDLPDENEAVSTEDDTLPDIETDESEDFGSLDDNGFSDFGDFGSSEENTFDTLDSSLDSDPFTLSETSEEEPLPEIPIEEKEEEKEEEVVVEEKEKEKEEEKEFYTPEPQVVSSPIKSESFNDVKQYVSNVTYGEMSQGGNPPFSIILKDIKYIEDRDAILTILKVHGLCNASNEADLKKGLDNGSILLSQLSEYSAVYLAHKLRRFDLEVQVGLSEELHPSKSYDHKNMGLVNKSSILTNVQENYVSPEEINISNVIVSTSNVVDGYQIVRYLGVVTNHSLIGEDVLSSLQDSDDDSIDESYQTLVDELKNKAIRKGGNGLIGVSFQFNPLPRKGEENIYKVTCVGTVVVLNAVTQGE